MILGWWKMYHIIEDLPTLGTGKINNFSAVAFSRFKLYQTAVGKKFQHRQIDVQLLLGTNAKEHSVLLTQLHNRL